LFYDPSSMRLANLAMVTVIANSACLAIPGYNSDGGVRTGDGSAGSDSGRAGGDGGDGGTPIGDLQLVLGSGCIVNPLDHTIAEGCVATITAATYSIAFDGSGTRLPNQWSLGSTSVLIDNGFQLNSSSFTFKRETLDEPLFTGSASLTVLLDGPAAIELLEEGSDTSIACAGSAGSAVASWSMSITAYPDGRFVRRDTLTPPVFDGNCSNAESFESFGLIAVPFDTATFTTGGTTQVLGSASISAPAGSDYQACFTSSVADGLHLAIAYHAPAGDHASYTNIAPQALAQATTSAQLNHGWLDSTPTGSASTSFEIGSSGSCGDLTPNEIDLPGLGSVGAIGDLTRGLYILADAITDVDLMTTGLPVAFQVPDPTRLPIVVSRGSAQLVPGVDYVSQVETGGTGFAIVWIAPHTGSGTVTIAQATP